MEHVDFRFCAGQCAWRLALAPIYGIASQISLGTVYLIFFYTELLAKPIEKIRTQMEDLQKADASISRIRELFAIQSEDSRMGQELRCRRDRLALNSMMCV